MSRIQSLTIQHFRGIPGSLTLDFTNTGSVSPVSLLLVGDNGTGKSSVADAIEFVLQGRIGRQHSLSHPGASHPVSFANTGLPKVRALLEDGSEVERDIVIKDGLPIISDRSAHPAFSFAAFVLRRSDILRFLDTSEDERQLMFVDYIGGRPGGDWAGSMEEHKKLLENEKKELREKIQEELRALAARYGWPEPSGMWDGLSFESMIRKRLYGGVDPKVAASRGIRVRLKPGTEAQITRIRALMQEFVQVSRGVRKAGKPGGNFLKAMATLRKVLASASDELSQSFAAISPARFVDRLEIVTNPDKQFALHVRVHLKNGAVCSPKQVFSEANQDLLAMLFFLAIVHEAQRNGQAPCLVLDDVLQSVDQGVRVAVTEHLVRQLKGWQFVFTAHDRLWQAQLRSILQREGHPHIEREITRWSFEAGPVIGGARTEDVVLLREALDRGDGPTICAQAGVLHEAIADRLSWTLPTSVVRRQGDRYTLGDLWPGIVRAMKKTAAGPPVEQVDRWVHLRNLAGAHYNEWARSLSTEEAISYGESVLRLLDTFRCPKCNRWVERAGTADRWSCRCGTTSIT